MYVLGSAIGDARTFEMGGVVAVRQLGLPSWATFRAIASPAQPSYFAGQ